MGQVVHARLDDETRSLLVRLRRRIGTSDSEIIRQAIRTLADLTLAPTRADIVGVGAFESGVPDLGSARKHLRGFGIK